MPAQVLTREELSALTDAQPTMLMASPSGLPLLNLLASLDRESLSQIMTEQHCQPGEVIFREGDSGDAAYLIWSGWVAVVKGDFATPTILGYRGPGEIIGEMALLEDQPRSASVVALENLRLLRIGRENFHHLLDSAPTISQSIMATLSTRLRESDNIRNATLQAGRQLAQQVLALESEKQQLLESQRIRQETSDLIIHDLRSPLSAISGVLNMLEVVLPPDVLQANRELLEIARSACGRMQRLTDCLLDVARLEAGERALQLAPVNLSGLVAGVASRLTLALQNRHVTLSCPIPPDLPAVMADEDMIDRVLTNLIDNAMKYSPRGGEITLTAGVAGDLVQISVTDEGPGIPPDERQRIFERFAQVSGERPAGSRRGFGLGLTFCKLAVEAHGGRIWVEPGENDVGSRFIFTLPYATGEKAVHHG